MLERFDEACAEADKTPAVRDRFRDTPQNVLSSAVHLFTQVGSNDRLDLFVSRAADLAKHEI
jgi:hypothetical protein